MSIPFEPLVDDSSDISDTGPEEFFISSFSSCTSSSIFQSCGYICSRLISRIYQLLQRRWHKRSSCQSLSSVLFTTGHNSIPDNMMNCQTISTSSRYCLEDRLLGKGSFGCIKRGIDSTSMEPVAVKVILNPVKNHHILKCCIRELVTLSSFRHKNIVAFRDCYMQGQQLLLVMDLCRQDLYSTIVCDELYQQLTSEDVTNIAFQLLEAVNYIHSRNIIHRDIKPSNILVGADGLIKLCDFGMSREVQSNVQDISHSTGHFLRQRQRQQNIGSFDLYHSEGKVDCESSQTMFTSSTTSTVAATVAAAVGVSDSRYTEYVVTRWYRAPEVILSCGIYDFAQDMWSVGCTLGELLKRRPLFPGTTFVHQLELIVNVLGKPRMIDSNFPMSIYGRKYLRAMPQINGKGLVSVLSPQMMSDAGYPLLVQLIGDLLSFDPNSRLTAGEALLSSLFRQEGIIGGDLFGTGDGENLPISFDDVNAARHDDINVLVNLLHTRVSSIHKSVEESEMKTMSAPCAAQELSQMSPLTDREDNTSSSSCNCLSSPGNAPLISNTSTKISSSGTVVKLTDCNTNRLGGNRGRRRSFRLRALPSKNATVNLNMERATSATVEMRAAEPSSVHLNPKVAPSHKEPQLIKISTRKAPAPRNDKVIDSSSIDDDPKDAQFSDVATKTDVNVEANANTSTHTMADAALPSSNNFRYTNLFLQRCLDGSSWKIRPACNQKHDTSEDTYFSTLHSDAKVSTPSTCTGTVVADGPLLPVICEHGQEETSALDTASKEINDELLPMIKQISCQSGGLPQHNAGRLSNMFARNGVISHHVTALQRLPSVAGRH